MVTIVWREHRLVVDGIPVLFRACDCPPVRIESDSITACGCLHNLNDILASGHMPRASVINWNGVCTQAVLAHIKMGYYALTFQFKCLALWFLFSIIVAMVLFGGAGRD